MEIYFLNSGGPNEMLVITSVEKSICLSDYIGMLILSKIPQRVLIGPGRFKSRFKEAKKQGNGIV